MQTSRLCLNGLYGLPSPLDSDSVTLSKLLHHLLIYYFLLIRPSAMEEPPTLAADALVRNFSSASALLGANGDVGGGVVDYVLMTLEMFDGIYRPGAQHRRTVRWAQSTWEAEP